MDWIKTSDRMPKPGVQVLVANLYKAYWVAHWDAYCETWVSRDTALGGNKGAPITHWCEIEPPNDLG